MAQSVKKQVVNVRYDKNRSRLKPGEIQLENGTYSYRWTAKNGKRHQIYAPTLVELRKKEEELIVDLHDGIRADVNRITVNQLFDVWQENKRGIKDNTMKNYIYMYNLFVRPVFGQRFLVTVKNSDVKRFYNRLADEDGLKVTTIDNIHNVLHQVFQVAVDDRLIRVNPADKMLTELKRAHSMNVKKREALTADEQKLFLNYLWNNPKNRKWYPIFFIMLNTGMRVGEATALRWCDVDMEQNTIAITHTLVYYDHMDSLGTYYSMNTPKTKAGMRIIPMTEKVKEAFLIEKQFQEDSGITCNISIDGYSNFVFLNRFGKVQTMSMLNKAIKRIMRDCNDEILSNAEPDEEVLLLPPFSCHTLRHTFATRLCESGMNIKVIQSVLGHADLTTTINTYIHATEAFKQEEFERQSAYLSIGAAESIDEAI